MPRGSLRKRTLKSGETVWDATFDIPPPVGKPRQQQRETFRGRKRDAEAELAKRVAEAWGLGIAQDRTLTVADFLADWLAHYRRRRKPASYQIREQIVRLHIVPVLGHVRLAALRPPQIRSWLDAKEDAGYAANYLRDMLGTLRAALSHAVAMELVTRNAADPVEAPARGDPVGKAWTVEEARRFLDAERHGPDFALWVVTANAQLRRGEAAGLRWEDVDAERATIRVARQLRRQSGVGVLVADPKTARSKRLLPMAGPVMVILAEHRRRQEERRQRLTELGMWSENDGWVFDRGDGAPCDPDVLGRRFVRACKRAGVPVLRFHDLRVTGITLMGESGVHEFTIRDRAGHSSVDTTRGYAHPGLGVQRAAAEALATMLGIGGEDVLVAERPAD